MSQRARAVGTHRERPHEARTTRQIPRSLLVVLLSITLAGCGSTGAGDEAASPPSASPDSSPSDTQDASRPDPRALGIDTVEWPGDQDGAQAVFDQMPDRLAGMRVKRCGWIGPSTGVQYGPNNTGVTAYVMGPEEETAEEMGEEMGGPQGTLMFMFAMGMVCVEDSYVGTAAKRGRGQEAVPDVDTKGEFGPEDGLWWFSCKFEGGESLTFTGHAIGWVSGDLAWLVTAPDKDTTRATVAALINGAE
jgi:hypothetical protein